MNSSLVAKVNWLMWCVEHEDKFLAYGSRKVNQLEMNVDYGYNDLNMFQSPFASGGFSGPISYDVTTSLRGFTVVTGNSELEAMILLFNTFAEEEREEKLRDEEIAAQEVARVARIKKEKKAHKKFLKARAEGKFDTTCLVSCSLCWEFELERQRQRHDDGTCDNDCDYCYNDCECCR